MTSEPEIFEFEPFRLDLRRQLLSAKGEAVDLRPKTWAVLHALVSRAGELVEKGDLLAEVWPDTAVEEKSLNAAVAEIRRALGDDARDPRYVATVHRRGFRFIAPVTLLGAGSAAIPRGKAEAEQLLSLQPGLVGRDEELASLRRLAAASSAGKSNLVFITGDAGMGKTALLDAFADSIEPEQVPALGRGACPLQPATLSPWLAALDDLLANLSDEDARQAVASSGPALLARLPRTRGGLASGERFGGNLSEEAIPESESLVADVLAMLASVSAQRCCAVLLEDLHRADTPSLDVLAGISALPQPSKLLVLATFRPVDALIEDHPVRSLCRRLREEGSASELRLDYLERGAVADYLQLRWPEAEGEFEVARLLRDTNGNPQAMKRWVDDALASRANARDREDAQPLAGEAEVLLLGRDEELKAIEELAGGGALLVHGPAGVGKTGLLAEAARRATAQGHDVLVGRCRVSGSAPAFWPWIEVLKAYIARRPPELVRAAAGRGVVEVARLVPSLREALPDLPSAAAIDPESSRLLLFEAISEFLKGASRIAPLTVILEDLHDADASSLDLWQFLAAECGPDPLRLVASYREVEEQTPTGLRTFLDGVGRDQTIRDVKLAGLASPETAALVAELAGGPVDAEVVDRMQQATAGNPLFVTHLWHHLVEKELVVCDENRWAGRFEGPHLGAPKALRETLAERVEGLPEDAHQVLSAAAVCGANLRFDIVRRVLDWPDERLLDALDDCLRGSVLEEVVGAPGSYRFTHFLLAEVLYAELSALRRARLHHSLAQTLVQRPKHSSLAELAYHAIRGASVGAAEEAVSLCVQAAAEARGQFAFESEAGFFREAIDLLDRYEVASPIGQGREDLLLGLAEALDHAGQGEAARSTFEDAAVAARASGNAALLSRAALGLAARGVSTDTGLLKLLDEALEALGDDDSILRTRLLGRRPHALYLMPDTGADRERACEEALVAARTLNDAALLGEVLVGCLDGMFQSDNLDQQSGFADALENAAVEAADQRLVFTAHAWRVVLNMTSGNLRAANEETRVCAQLAGELRLPRFRWQTKYFEAALAMAAGRVEEAEALAIAAAEIGRSVNEDATAAVMWGQLLAIRGELGNVGTEDAAPSLKMSDRDTVALFERVRYFLPYALWEQGREEEGRAAFDALLAEGLVENLPSDTSRNVRLPAVAAVVEMCAALEDRSAAKQLQQVLTSYDHQWVVAGWGVAVLSPVAHLQAMVAGVLGEWEQSFALFERALAVERAEDARLAEARTLYQYARALQRRGAKGDTERATAIREAALAGNQGLSMHHTSQLLEQLG